MGGYNDRARRTWLPNNGKCGWDVAQLNSIVTYLQYGLTLVRSVEHTANYTEEVESLWSSRVM